MALTAELTPHAMRVLRLLVFTRKDVIHQIYHRDDLLREAHLRDLKAFCDEVGLDYSEVK